MRSPRTKPEKGKKETRRRTSPAARQRECSATTPSAAPPGQRGKAPTKCQPPRIGGAEAPPIKTERRHHPKRQPGHPQGLARAYVSRAKCIVRARFFACPDVCAPCASITPTPTPDKHAPTRPEESRAYSRVYPARHPCGRGLYVVDKVSYLIS